MIDTINKNPDNPQPNGEKSINSIMLRTMPSKPYLRNNSKYFRFSCIGHSESANFLVGQWKKVNLFINRLFRQL